MLVREWKGKLERVMVLESGFAWNGKSYSSLSQIAKAMTGTAWNGHRFFGLRTATSDRAAQARAWVGGRGRRPPGRMSRRTDLQQANRSVVAALYQAMRSHQLQGARRRMPRTPSQRRRGRVMKPANPKASLRCAVYTRVSTEHGLEQEFNSLDNQREASEAYIKSQAHEGWRLMRDRYDDGGFSGGSMERPALKKLLDAVRARRIDVIVVYKVDRLTRSLADFAKLVELFDEHQVSFVSVTQAFNTTTSMGRLTLNVLLSFAQFEREVTGERIRDKIAASKKKGIWMGGVVPLGYRVDNRALHVVEEHAAFVRDLFRRYLEIGSVVRLKAALDQENVRLPIRTDGRGKTTGGGLISRGHLYKILSNPIYVGRLTHKDQVHEGLHDPIVDHETWNRVQRLLAEHAQDRAGSRQDSDALLAGKLFDDRGNRMSPSHATKRGRRYRYYVSQAILQGRKADAGSVARVPAMEIERRVVEAVRGAAPTDRRERSIETQIIRRASDRPVAAIDSAASARRPARPRSRRRPSRRRRAHHDPPHHVGDSACRRDRGRRAGSDHGRSLDTAIALSTPRDHSGGRRTIRCGAPDANQSARGSHRCPPRRPSLARRTDDRFEPHDRVHRCPREEDRTLDPPDDVARLPFSGPRQSGDRRTAAARLRRQAADGPSDRMVGSVVRARSQGARIGRIETRSAQPIIRRTQVSIRDRGHRQVVRRSLPHQVQPAHLGNGILRPETRRRVPAQEAGQTRLVAAADRARPC